MTRTGSGNTAIWRLHLSRLLGRLLVYFFHLRLAATPLFYCLFLRLIAAYHPLNWFLAFSFLFLRTLAFLGATVQGMARLGKTRTTLRAPNSGAGTRRKTAFMLRYIFLVRLRETERTGWHQTPAEATARAEANS